MVTLSIENYLIAGGVVLVCIGLFIVSYLLNKKTPKPDGCEEKEEHCDTCGITSCFHHPSKNENKEEE